MGLSCPFPLKTFFFSGSSYHPSSFHHLQGCDLMSILICVADQLLSVLAFIWVTYFHNCALNIGLKTSRSFSNSRCWRENKRTKRLH